MATSICPISAGAADIVTALHADIFTAPHDEPWSCEFLRKILSTPGTTAFIAQDTDLEDRSPFGFALIRISGEEGEVLSLGVKPPMRRRGIGSDLLRTVFQFTAALGAESMVLEVAEMNVPAMELYRKWGFLTVGRRRNYFRHGDGRDDAIILRAPTSLVT